MYYGNKYEGAVKCNVKCILYISEQSEFILCGMHVTWYKVSKGENPVINV